MACSCKNIKTDVTKIECIDHIEHLHTTEKQTYQESFWHGVSWSAGTALFSSAGYVAYKVGSVAYNAFLGAKAGATAGAPLGPYLAIPISAAGAVGGAVKGMLT